MIKIQQKLIGTVATAALLASTFASPTFAETIRISENGRGSDNNISIRSTSSKEISQSNNADFDTNVTVDSNTGGNRSNDNTRGNNRVRSGDSNTDVDVSNFANVNYARIGGGSSDWNDDHNNNDWNNRNNDWDNRNNNKDWSNNHDLAKNNDWNNKDWSNNDNNDNHKDNDNRDWSKDYDWSNKDNHDKDNHDKDYSHDNHDKNDNHDNHDGDSNDGKRTFDVYVIGHHEVPGPGDQDGDGNAQVSINPRNDEVCVDMHVNKISTPTAAHIHYGMPGVKGPVVVGLPTPNADGDAHGCVSANHDEVGKILQNPSHYYVNIHSTEYPDGALRGQL